MTSTTDLDQGGTARQWVRTYLGPTVGWVDFIVNNVLNVATTGTTTVPVGTTLVAVDVNATVTLQLPSAIPALGIPTSFAGVPITVVDIGGFAGVHTITILPFGTEKIMGLNSLDLATAYGSWRLLPNTTSGGWEAR